MLPRFPSRRTALTAVLAAPLLAASLAGCGGADGASTAAVATSASTSTPAPATTPAGPSTAAPVGPSEELPDRAEALGAAFTAGDFGAVWDLACPGVRDGASRDDYVATMAAAPEVELTNPTVVDAEVTDETRAELADAGVAYDDEALVRFDVAPGGNYANPTMTAWFVGTDTGWLYCGMVPDA